MTAAERSQVQREVVIIHTRRTAYNNTACWTLHPTQDLVSYFLLGREVRDCLPSAALARDVAGYTYLMASSTASLEISSVGSEARAVVGSRPRQWHPLEPDGARSSWPARLPASRALGVVVLAASFLAIVVGVHIRSSEYASCAPRWAWQRWASCASYTCLGGFPQFNTHAELAAHEPWARYFRGVYGSLPRHEGAYPLCVGELWLLYTAGLEAAGVPLADLPETAACPRDDGARHWTT